ncbi:hypothetical protein CRG49_000615 [Neisseria sp. N95_16]|uniref:Uncharacterized protein n=1 Tax=Neisseria brasiliensis TaxID=2666100 RepID=A0A7X2GZK9_9NEIS|nr:MULTISPECIES: hypothetical protein [Neisseria]MRN38604.1 hypothetical protein [Neisseria brasiliensis]PJO10755.1 hypothetical protein CRG49_000615 [Neisseria sp. N95_16]
MKVYAVKALPLWNPVDCVLIGQEPVEVSDSPWIRAQLRVGNFVEVVEAEEVTKKPTRTPKAASKS